MPKIALIHTSNNARVMAAALALILCGASLAGCATAGPGNPYNLSSDRLALVSDICHSTIGGSDSDPHFGVCVDSLSAKMSERERIERLAQADVACRASGAQADSTLALCVLDRTTNKMATAVARPTAPDIHQREKIACAKIGLNPIGGSFADCVAEMQDGFDKVDAPMTN